MCQPAHRRRHFGFLFTSRPAPGDGSSVLYEDRPGTGAQGLRRKGLTPWLLHANLWEGPRSLFTPERVHTCPPPFDRCQVQLGPKVPGVTEVPTVHLCQTQTQWSPAVGTPALGTQCLPTTLFAAGVLSGFPEFFPESLEAVPELLPSSCLDNRSSPTMPKVWLSRPLRPLVSHLSPPGSLRSSPDLRCPLPEAAPGAGLHR